MGTWKQYKNVLAPHLSYDAWTDVSVEAQPPSVDRIATRRRGRSHLPSANITIGTAAVSDGQFGIAHDVHRPAVSTDKVSARGECWGAHRGIICALALQE
jgi:hypothetical protein